MSQYDLPGLYEFLSNTPEQGLRKMLVDGKPMKDGHFNLLLKVVRNSQVQDFCNYCEKEEFPKVKLGPSEQKVKDRFWKDCMSAFQQRGLLNPAIPAKVA